MKYVIRLLLITLLLSPALWMVILVISGITHLQNVISSVEGIFPILYLGGLFISIPVFCAFYLVYSIIGQQDMSVRKKKMILSLTGILLVTVTFMIIDSSMLTGKYITTQLLFLSYAFTVVFFTCISTLTSTESAR